MPFPRTVIPAPKGAVRMPFRYFHRTGGARPETLPNFNYDAPEEVCYIAKKIISEPSSKMRHKTYL